MSRALLTSELWPHQALCDRVLFFPGVLIQPVANQHCCDHSHDYHCELEYHNICDTAVQGNEIDHAKRSFLIIVQCFEI